MRVLTTTDHKTIGKLYLVTSFGWFLVGGLMAMVMRSELAYPGNQVVNDELYNQLFTMHGTIMLLLFATPLCMRAPGMTMFRMPFFVWNTLVTSLLVLIAFPVLGGALLMLEADRLLGAHVFDAANGGAILWQHLFWFFGHPEVYIIALPAARRLATTSARSRGSGRTLRPSTCATLAPRESIRQGGGVDAG